MKAHLHFKQEIFKLKSFYSSTSYSYDQTDAIIKNYKANRIEFNVPNETGLSIKQPHFYKTKHTFQVELRKKLLEIIFVRLVSALEVYLVDLIRDAFIANKEPFKKQEIKFEFTQGELLSVKSTSELYNKVINAECRKLTSGGFQAINKYYKKYFDIELSEFAPGKTKMDEYHLRRHLLVHRLGKTDEQYRSKYNSTDTHITIGEKYLFTCISDFSSFAEMINNQIKYKLENEFTKKAKREKQIDEKVKLKIEFLSNTKPEYLEPNFEFWANDDLCIFANIIDDKKLVEANKLEIDISGTTAEIKGFLRIIRKAEKKEEISVTYIKEKSSQINVTPKNKTFLDDETLNKIKESLPAQPWETGIHKKVAADLGIANRLVSVAIQQLIVKKVFKQQIDGVVIEPVTIQDTPDEE